jgi:hypothetical protein
MDVHLIDGTYELFRHFFAVPAAADVRRRASWASFQCPGRARPADSGGRRSCWPTTITTGA